MDGKRSRRLEDEHLEHVDSERERSGNTRRSFLKDVGKKAIYVTPVVMTLSAERAQASATQPSCGFAGSPCTTDDDCCGCCDDGGMNPTFLCEGDPGCAVEGEACVDDSDCCSDRCDNMMDPTLLCEPCM